MACLLGAVTPSHNPREACDCRRGVSPAPPATRAVEVMQAAAAVFVGSGGSSLAGVGQRRSSEWGQSGARLCPEYRLAAGAGGGWEVPWMGGSGRRGFLSLLGERQPTVVSWCCEGGGSATNSCADGHLVEVPNQRSTVRISPSFENYSHMAIIGSTQVWRGVAPTEAEPHRTVGCWESRPHIDHGWAPNSNQHRSKVGQDRPWMTRRGGPNRPHFHIDQIQALRRPNTMRRPTGSRSPTMPWDASVTWAAVIP